MSDSECRAVHILQDWLRVHGGDSSTEPNCSPRGDGRWVPLSEVFPRSDGNRSNAQRQAIRRLHRNGVLARYEIAFHGDCVKAVPVEMVGETESGADKIDALAVIARECGTHDKWGTRPPKESKGILTVATGMLCSGCDRRAIAAGLFFEFEEDAPR